MKLRHILNVVLFIPMVVFGQSSSPDFSIEAGSPFPEEYAYGYRYENAFEVGKTKMISVKVKSNKVIVQRYDTDTLNQLSVKTYEDFPEGSKLQNVIKSGERLFYFFSYFLDKDDSHVFNVREINTETGSFMNSIILFKTKGDVSYGRIGTYVSRNLYVGPLFEIIESLDKSKLLITYRRKPINKRNAINKDLLGYYVFSNSLKLVWGGEIEFPYTEKNMDNLGYTLSNTGIIYQLASLNEERRIELFVIKNASDLIIQKINIDFNMYFISIQLKENFLGNISCIGTYRNSISSAYPPKMAGIFRFQLDKEGKVLNQTKTAFSESFIKSNIPILVNQNTSVALPDKEIGLGGLRPCSTEEFADGSALIIFESFYIINSNNYALIYNYDDIVLTKLDKNGKLLWMVKIPKSQSGMAGFKYISSEGYSYIIYYDNPVNVNLNPKKRLENYPNGCKGILMIYKINQSTGEFKRNVIFNTENINAIKGGYTELNSCIQKDNKTFITNIITKDKTSVLIKIQTK